jgi:hypothetical protein
MENTVFHVTGNNVSRIGAIHHLKKGLKKLEEMSRGQLRTNLVLYSTLSTVRLLWLLARGLQAN